MYILGQKWLEMIVFSAKIVKISLFLIESKTITPNHFFLTRSSNII